MSTKNKGYQSDRPAKGEKKETKIKDTVSRAGKKGGNSKRKRISEQQEG